MYIFEYYSIANEVVKTKVTPTGGSLNDYVDYVTTTKRRKREHVG